MNKNFNQALKKNVSIVAIMLVFITALVGCGNKEVATAKIDLADGQYLAEFNTDSSMFHINEAKDGKGILTVENGQAVIHIVMPSDSIQKLYVGVAEAAKNDEANLIAATSEEVSYPDGTTDTANAFDLPVPVLDEEFDCALIGKKGVWYDHKVSVTNPVPMEEVQSVEVSDEPEVPAAGEYVDVVLHGGSGKSTVESPAKLEVGDDGKSYVTIIWSSPNYDYMIVDGEKYLPVNEDGNSTFIIPIADVNGSMEVIADTVAMSKPHEIEYELEFSAK